MARAAKRKADIEASPPGSPKKTRARKIKKNGITLSDFDLPDSEEDEGHSQSQQFLLQAKKALQRKAAKNSDGYADKFQAAVAEKKQALLGLLNERSSSFLAQRTKGHAALTSLLSGSLKYKAPSSLDTNTSRTAGPLSKATIHPLQQKADVLFALSKDLLSTYDKVSQEIAAYEETLQVDEDWAADCQRLQHLLDVGKQVTEHRVVDLLADKQNGWEADAEKDEPRQKDRKLWGKVTGVGDGEEGESWADAARKIEKGVRRLVRGLSKDEDVL